VLRASMQQRGIVSGVTVTDRTLQLGRLSKLFCRIVAQ
jgi:hypothetical protein